MKKFPVILMTSLFCFPAVNLCAAQQDVAGCKDHPLVPRLPGYYIVACAENAASFDMEPVPGKNSGPVHIEGKSRAVTYSLQPEIQPKPDRSGVLKSFENAAKKYDVALVGTSNTMPVYKLVNGGKEVWVIVLADAVGGGYAYRIIEKGDVVETKKAEPQNSGLDCEKYGPPFFAPLPGYQLCGCGEAESRNQEVKMAKGKAPATVRIKGRSTQMTYCPQDDRRSKLGETQVRRNFENEIRKQRGIFVGKTAKDPKVDIYKLTRDRRETWIEVWTETNGDYNYVVTR